VQYSPETQQDSRGNPKHYPKHLQRHHPKFYNLLESSLFGSGGMGNSKNNYTIPE